LFPNAPPILSLDPGLTTGYALVTAEGLLSQSGNIGIEDLKDSSILESIKKIPGLSIVIEEVPIYGNSKLGRQLQQVNATLREMFPEAVKLPPSAWKTIPSISNFPVPSEWDGKKLTQHQKDSYRMGMFFIIFRKGVLSVLREPQAS